MFCPHYWKSPALGEVSGSQFSDALCFTSKHQRLPQTPESQVRLWCRQHARLAPPSWSQYSSHECQNPRLRKRAQTTDSSWDSAC